MLVTNGETRPALAITRSLGSQGHAVTVVADRLPALASVSRHCSARESCPDPLHAPEAFADAVAGIAARRGIELLLPVNEIATRLLARHRDRLPPGCVLPLPADAALDVANDKASTLALARELGIPVPQSETLQRGEAPSVTRAFPVVIKPARSRVRHDYGWSSGAADYARDAGELSRKIAALAPELFPVLVQERVTGEGVGLFACFWHGRPVAWFSHRRLREKPPSGGVSVLCESVPLDPAARRHAEALLSALGWHGVAMVEFKRDARDGRLKLLEVNGRFWGSLQLAIDAGVDFPGIVARLAQGEPVPPVADYRLGIRSRWFLGDLDALLSLWTRESSALHLPAGHPGRLRTLLQFLQFWKGGQRNEVLRGSDLRPGLLELRRWLAGR